MDKEKDPLTGIILKSAFEVHSQLGPGLLESAYEQCLCHELLLREASFVRQKSIPVVYKGQRVDCGYRADVIVEDAVIIEVKAIEKLMPIHSAQLLTYLKLTNLKTGLLLNFNVVSLKDGIKRMAN